ncbi:hypothetical protein [Planctomicrobium sp. SH664]|uniref:hypothetical protein n=1 Tax=Planctomicrobium sp. SH664 TaxID=3448125 RepID=UPI003F5C6EC1
MKRLSTVDRCRVACGPDGAHSRSGIVLLLSVALIAVSTAVIIVVLRTLLLMEFRVEHRHQVAQARLVAESALDRAARQIQNDSHYAGETYSMTLPGRDFTSATITVSVSPGAVDGKQAVQVVAILSDQTPAVVRYELEGTLLHNPSELN